MFFYKSTGHLTIINPSLLEKQSEATYLQRVINPELLPGENKESCRSVQTGGGETNIATQKRGCGISPHPLGINKLG
jgi:hypothetical protein